MAALTRRRWSARIQLLRTRALFEWFRIGSLLRFGRVRPIDTSVGRLTVRSDDFRAFVLARMPALQQDTLRVWCELAIPGVDVRAVPWRAATEVDDLRPLDVGLMPLPDDEWTRGKGGMKALQYMGLAIPPVVSPVGANAAIVQDGVNGFHARSEDEWVARVGSLLADPALRARLGAAGRRTVEETYSAGVQAPRMARVLREAAGR